MSSLYIKLSPNTHRSKLSPHIHLLFWGLLYWKVYQRLLVLQHTLSWRKEFHSWSMVNVYRGKMSQLSFKSTKFTFTIRFNPFFFWFGKKESLNSFSQFWIGNMGWPFLFHFFSTALVAVLREMNSDLEVFFPFWVISML